jgi:hypothetical protein
MNDLLEVLQADITAILLATPALSYAVILSDDDGDIEAKVARALGPLKGGPTSKQGLVIVTLLPEVTTAEENLPGPPLLVRCEIRVLENVLANRSSIGTGQRSSQAALAILGALHHHSLGSHALYAEKNPIEPVEVKPGHVSHAITLFARSNGLQGPGKCAAVDVAMSEGGVTTLTTLTTLTAGAAIYYTTDGSYPSATSGTLYTAPFAAPAVGTSIRAAAYAPGLNPGDCLQFTIQE